MELTFHCFGASTSTGEALRNLVGSDLLGYSRNPSSSSHWLYPADLRDPEGFYPSGNSSDPSVWISFAPIWLFAPFLESLATFHPDRLHGLRGVVACSSSSAITKRFAFNRFDRHLVTRLISAEDLLISTCRRLSIPCFVLRPTLIYGQVGAFGDRNLSQVLKLLRRFPLLLIPSDSGLRQPIHASQLAAVALHLASQFTGTELNHSSSQLIAVGGDTTLSYFEMIFALQQAQPSDDPARRCHLLSVPNRLFFLLSALLLIRSPKSYEAVLRMGANLSGFTPAHQILGSEAKHFPVLPYA